jgi:UDP-N-acetylglucosamine 1-carboxyvinyltransferase
MESFVIKGGKPLKGKVTLSGAKNAASKLLLASLLTDEQVVVTNVPKQRETAITQEILETVGAKVSWDDHVVTTRTETISNTEVTKLSRKNRLSVLAIAPLLHRSGQATVPIVGGDKIGPRPVNFHTDALEQMGAKFESRGDAYHATVDGRLKGALIELPYPSVGATETCIFAGVLAEGRTVIRNAATEPEIFLLVQMLQKMGAIIEPRSGRVIEITGVEKLHGCQIEVFADPLEAASYACAAIATRGEVFVRGARHEQMITFLNAVRRLGGIYEVQDDGILFKSNGEYHSIDIETDTYPGFRTDWMQPFVVLLTQAKGVSRVHETVFDDRLGFTKTLNEMGADIERTYKCLGELQCRFKDQNHMHSATVNGPTNLSATEIEVPDIRAGLALVLGALVAEGESRLTGIEHLDRGYERLEEKLRGIGADICREG